MKNFAYIFCFCLLTCGCVAQQNQAKESGAFKLASPQATQSRQAAKTESDTDKTESEDDDDDELALFNSVVKIQTTSCSPDFVSPWANRPQQQSSGTGFVIDGNLILTNAHNIADATYITVSKNNDGFPATAKVFAVCHDSDLALLKVQNENFFKDTKPLQLGETPKIQSVVKAVGYPIGGNEISVTQGIISRIECIDYAQSFYGNYLAAQLDAAINPGNSGGPVLYNGKVVGIAFQVDISGEGIGYMIHSDVIKRFLKDAQDGKIDGYGVMGIRNQDLLLNPDARKALNLREDQSGAVVVDLLKSVQASPAIMVNDVITAIDGYKISNNMNIKNRRGQNVRLETVVAEKQLGEYVVLSLLRNGKAFTSKVKICKPWHKVAPFIYDNRPKYLLAGGLVFSTLSLSYMGDLSDETPPQFAQMLNEFKDDGELEYIVLTQVLGDETTTGYQTVSAQLLESVNGRRVKTLVELAKIIDGQKTGYLSFKFNSGLSLVVDAAKIKSSMPDILKRYNIAKDRNL